MKDDLHVIPLNDLHEHIMSANCPCKPKVKVIGAILIYTHNSWDHRELIEQVEKWLSYKENGKY